MLNFYLDKGANLDLPPDTVSKLYIDHSRTSEYRKAPFIVQAACHGDPECFETLIKRGAKITEIGYIGLSKKKKNQVVSNLCGAAAYNGSTKIIQLLMKKRAMVNIEYQASEK